MSENSILRARITALKVNDLKNVLRKCGLRVYGNKPELIQRLIQTVESYRSTNTATLASDDRYQSVLMYIAVEEAKYSRRPAMIPASAVMNIHQSPDLVSDYSPILPAIQADRVPKPVHPFLSSFTLEPNDNIAQQSHQPFNQVSFPHSPFHITHSRLYSKITQGRAGTIVISDFNLRQNAIDLLKTNKYAIKIFMGNPQQIMPFGYTKTIDLYFTETCKIIVNNNIVDGNKIQPPKKTPWASVAPEITQFLILKPLVNNKIIVHFGPMLPKCLLVIELVLKIPPTAVAQTILKSFKISREDSVKELIKRNSSGDDDIVATAQIVSMRDTVSQCRIDIPARSKECKHIQCFDLATFFAMNERRPVFNCSICNNRIQWEDVIVDEYFQDMLIGTSGNQPGTESCETAEVLPDGTWSPILAGTSTPLIKGEYDGNNPNQQSDIICLDDDDDETATSLKPKPEPTPLHIPKRPRMIINHAPEVIDLTLSEDDDVHESDMDEDVALIHRYVVSPNSANVTTASNLKNESIPENISAIAPEIQQPLVESSILQQSLPSVADISGIEPRNNMETMSASTIPSLTIDPQESIIENLQPDVSGSQLLQNDQSDSNASRIQENIILEQPWLQVGLNQIARNFDLNTVGRLTNSFSNSQPSDQAHNIENIENTISLYRDKNLNRGPDLNRGLENQNTDKIIADVLSSLNNPIRSVESSISLAAPLQNAVISNVIFEEPKSKTYLDESSVLSNQSNNVSGSTAKDIENDIADSVILTQHEIDQLFDNSHLDEFDASVSHQRITNLGDFNSILGKRKNPS